MPPYIVLNKAIGETPLSCAEAWRSTHPEYVDVPLAYAGRLDPMASGKLLVLIGEECKRQTEYHDLDKTYEFSTLFGIASDSLDVLGRLTLSTESAWSLDEAVLKELVKNLIGPIELPYPKFSAKTVQGKPLHMWTLEGRLNEITIPTKQSEIYAFTLDSVEHIEKSELVKQALAKVNSIPEVTDPRKALGNDFRRGDVRADWNAVMENPDLPTHFTIAHFTCTAGSGTYMRTLASLIAERLGTCGLAWHIHRTHIGTFDATSRTLSKEYV